MITFSHMRRAAHAIGANAHSQSAYDLTPPRNHFVSDGCDVHWRDLVKAGLATVETPPSWSIGSALYRLTADGIRLTHMFLDLAARDRAVFAWEGEEE